MSMNTVTIAAGPTAGARVAEAVRQDDAWGYLVDGPVTVGRLRMALRQDPYFIAAQLDALQPEAVPYLSFALQTGHGVVLHTERPYEEACTLVREMCARSAPQWAEHWDADVDNLVLEPLAEDNVWRWGSRRLWGSPLPLSRRPWLAPARAFSRTTRAGC